MGVRPFFGVEQTSTGFVAIPESDPTATLAVQRGNGFQAVSSPYQCARPNSYDAVT
jgi:hypothetical protein